MDRMKKPPAWEVFWLFLRIGNTTFGGGDPTMAALEREMVERRRWITPEQFGLSYSLARLTPGTNVLAFSAATAWIVRGWLGAILAVLGSSVPPAILAVWLVHAYDVWVRNAAAQAMMSGMVAAVAGMTAAGAVLLFRGQAGRAGLTRGLFLSGAAALLVGWLGVSPVIVLALGALAGYLWEEPAKECLPS